jgi:protocatechuate 3,4-dioxygenase beta subunit
MGYLKSTQTSGGAWKDSGGEPSVFVTALAMRSLWYSRHDYAVADSLDNAQAWVLTQWGTKPQSEPFDVALSLLAVLPRLSHAGPVDDMLTSLRMGQRTDGSWGGDIYTTALALRALIVAARPVPNPDRGMLFGRVVDGDTGLPLAGVEVVLEGASSGFRRTDEVGAFRFQDLNLGDHSILFSLADYGGLSATTRLDHGVVIDLSELALVKDRNAQNATLRGRVTEAESGRPLAGVLVSTERGQGTFSAEDGTYQVASLEPGLVSVSASLAGYVSASGTANIAAGDILDFSPALAQSVPPGQLPDAAVFGQVTDASDDTPLAGASVTVLGAAGVTALSDAEGRYRIEPVEPGTQSIRIELDGYYSVVAEAEVTAHQQIQFSPALSIVESPPSLPEASLYGRVIDAVSGTPLANALVETSGSVTASVRTDGQGRYLVTPLAEGGLDVRISLDGYQTASISRFAELGQDLELSVALMPMDSEEPTANVTGIVVDSTTNEPLADVLVNVFHGGMEATLVSGSDGRFRIEDIGASTLDLHFTLAGYFQTAFALVLDPLRNQDIGQIRLRPDEVESLLPDLTPAELDTSGMLTDPQSLEVAGTLETLIENRGYATVARAFDVLAFYDVDGNGDYTEGGDDLLGRAAVPAGLAAGAANRVEMSLAGNLPFRNAPVSVLADSAQVVAELVETNNSADTSGLCKIEPPKIEQLNPVVKWHWDLEHVDNTPIVAPLIDTNGDGRTDQRDVPAVLFVSYSKPYVYGNGTIRAIRGDTGEEIWSLTDPQDDTFPEGGLAVADLDGDG